MTKEKLLEAINEMPQQIELEALFEKLIFIDKVERGLWQVEAGKTSSHSEVLNEVSKWKK